MIDAPEEGAYDAIILAVAHKEIADMGVQNIRKLGKAEHVLFDIKYLYKAEEVDGRL